MDIGAIYKKYGATPLFSVTVYKIVTRGGTAIFLLLAGAFWGVYLETRLKKALQRILCKAFGGYVGAYTLRQLKIRSCILFPKVLVGRGLRS
jgi:hypothetical protein